MMKYNTEINGAPFALVAAGILTEEIISSDDKDRLKKMGKYALAGGTGAFIAAPYLWKNGIGALSKKFLSKDFGNTINNTIGNTGTSIFKGARDTLGLPYAIERSSLGLTTPVY